MTENRLTQSGRVEWIDLARGVGILLVLLGHVNATPFLARAYIYSFHMPLFFVLSGLVFRASGSFRVFVSKKARTLLVPYCAFLVVYIVALCAAQILFHVVDDSVPVIIRGLVFQEPAYVFAIWFFVVLFCTELLFYLLVKLAKDDLRVILCVCGVVLALGVLYFCKVQKQLIWQLQICFTSIPFFGIGYFLQKRKGRRIPERYTLATGLLLLAVSGGVFAIKCLFFEPYTSLTSNQYGNFFVFYALSLSAIGGVLLLCERVGVIRPVNYLGRNTVVLFSLQQPLVQIPIKTVLTRVYGADFFDRLALPQRLGLTALELAVTLAILLAVNAVICKTPLCVLIGRKHAGRDKKKA